MSTPRPILRGLLIGILALASRGSVFAQIDPRPTRQTSSADSTRLLREARSRQGSFERLRRSRLPESWGGGSSYCDERIGRFCLSYSREREDWSPPPEPEIVRVERSAFTDFLGDAARQIPGDEWIAGQRVRYLVEARRFVEASAAAAACRADRSWCAALAGFAYHYAALPALADSAFDTALRSMDGPERDRWTDLSLILEEPTVRAYRRLRGNADDRTAFEAHFWRLADPLLSRPGNELRSEHLSRHVWDRLQERAQPSDGVSWGADLREILIRYGWPSGWERPRAQTYAVGPPPMTTHYSSSPQTLVPPTEALLEEDGTNGVWDVEDYRSRTGYNVPLADSIARWFTPIASQVAVFARGRDALVVGAYELPRDSVAPNEAVVAAIALLPTDEVGGAPRVTIADKTGPSGVVTALIPARPLLVSIEVIAPALRRVARARSGRTIAPVDSGALALSDILLFNPITLADSLAGVMDQALASNRVSPTQQIGLYWEAYGLDSTSEAMSMSLQLVPASIGWLRRLGQGAGIVREVLPVRIRWQEPAVGRSMLGRSLQLSIPEVGPGDYFLELTAEVPGRDPVTVRKPVVITSRPRE